MAGLFTRPLARTSQYYTRRNISLTAVAGDALGGPADSGLEKEHWEHWRQQKSRQLLSGLSDPWTPPSRIWAYYKDFFTHGAAEDLPLDTHQQVLRRCVAPTPVVRQGAAARIRESHGHDAKHLYESRLQRVISMIRAAGLEPTVDDYDFVLEQFAAAGYQSGAWKVFQELTTSHLEPSERSYTLVLRAVTYRLSLPCAQNVRTTMESEASEICNSILDDMDKRGYSTQPVHVDLVLRITRTTGKAESFFQLLRQAYGIDLENPDRIALSSSDNGLPSLVDSTEQPLPEFHPFNVHVLNTILQFLGSADRVSQMIVAFEVLTTPLSRQRSSESFTSDDDDDAHAFYDLSDASHASPRALPSASPNTGSYNALIKNFSRLQKHSLVRHYLVDAIRTERRADNILREDLKTKSPEDATIPKVFVRKSALEAALGLGNRSRRISFLMWLWREAKWLLGSKRQRLDYYSAVQHQFSESALLEEQIATTLADLPNPVAAEEDSLLALWKPPPSQDNPEPPDELALWRPPSADGIESSHPRTPLTPSMAPDPMAPSPSVDTQPARKPFSLEQHVAVLARDHKEIEELLVRIRRAVWRLVARRKEWLGRRVWAGKKIYLTTDGRTEVTRERWTSIANFREPWKVGKKANLVKLQEGKLRDQGIEGKLRFVLPYAAPHKGVDPRFIDPATTSHRPRIRWRGG